MIDVSTHIAGRYRVDARLGGGGMADVFEAYDEVLDRPVAVKILRGIDDPGAARRFAEEIRLTARVNHPNIVLLFNAGEHDGSPFLVLERVSGGTLAGEMAAGPMDPRRVATIGEQLASALSHSHAAGIVHRDVKSTNVLLTGDGDVRLADFGIAITATATRLTVAGSIAGSAGYVSPEQVLGTGAGAASDVESLGMVLLECLVAAPPWSGTTVEVALARLNSDPVIPDTLPEGWAPLLRAMTARDPEDRPSIDMAGLALSQLAVGDTPDTQMFAPPAAPSDRRVPVVAGMSMLLLLFSAVFVLSTQSPPGDALALTNFAVAGDYISPLAAERGAIAAEIAASDEVSDDDTRLARREDTVEESRRRARRSARNRGAVAADSGTGGGTTQGDEPTLVQRVLDTASGVTRTATGSAGGTTSVGTSDPAPVRDTVGDTTITVKDIVHAVNRAKGKRDTTEKTTTRGSGPRR